MKRFRLQEPAQLVLLGDCAAGQDDVVRGAGVEPARYGLTIEQRPLFGVGFGNFTEYHFRTAHNSFVLWAYGHEGEGITVTGPTQKYVRGKWVEFHFCPACGCVAFWRGQHEDEQGRRRIAVNLRLAEPDAVARIPIDRFDGLDTFSDLPRDGRCVADYWA